MLYPCPLHPPLGGGTPVGPAINTRHQRVVFIRVAGNDEVGFIVNAAIAFTAKAESVLTPFHREGRNFITSSIVFFVVTGENTLCSLGPVVLGGGVGSSLVHRSSHVYVSGGSYHLSQRRKSISILSSRLGKSVEHQKNSGRRHMSKKNIHRLYFVFLGGGSHVIRVGSHVTSHTFTYMGAQHRAQHSVHTPSWKSCGKSTQDSLHSCAHP